MISGATAWMFLVPMLMIAAYGVASAGMGYMLRGMWKDKEYVDFALISFVAVGFTMLTTFVMLQVIYSLWLKS